MREDHGGEGVCGVVGGAAAQPAGGEEGVGGGELGGVARSQHHEVAAAR